MRITGLLSVLVVYDSDLFAHVQALWNDILSEIKKKDTNTHVRASICCHNINHLISNVESSNMFIATAPKDRHFGINAHCST